MDRVIGLGAGGCVLVVMALWWWVRRWRARAPRARDADGADLVRAGADGADVVRADADGADMVRAGADGADMVLPVRLRGSGSAFPAIAERGSLRITGSSLTWRPDRHCAPTVDLSQYGVIGAATATGPGEIRYPEIDSLALVLYGPQGGVALSGDLGTIGVIRHALRSWTPRAALPGEAPAMRYPTRVTTAAARFWMMLWLLAGAFFVALPATATRVSLLVAGRDGQEVTLTWADPWSGLPRSSTAQPEPFVTLLPGTRVAGFVHPWAPSEPWTAGLSYWYVPAVVLVAVGALIAWLVTSRVLRIRAARRGPVLDLQADVDLAAAAVEADHARPVMPAAGQQTYSRLAVYLAERAAHESWGDQPELRPRRWWVLSGRMTWALALAPAVLFLGLFGVAWLLDLRALATSPTAMAAATVVSVTPGPWFPVAESEVSFVTADGRKVSAFPATQAAQPGAVVTVRYVLDDPGRATVVGPRDASTRAARLSIASLAFVVGLTGFMLSSRLLPALRGSRPGYQVVRLRYLRVRHPIAGDGLVLFDAGYDSPPRWLLGVLGRLGPDVPLAGVAEFTTRTGELGDGEWVHPVVAGRQWFAAEPIVAIPGDRVDAFCLDVLTDSIDFGTDDWTGSRAGR